MISSGERLERMQEDLTWFKEYATGERGQWKHYRETVRSTLGLVRSTQRVSRFGYLPEACATPTTTKG